MLTSPGLLNTEQSQHPQSSEVQGRFSSKQETALESREHLPEVMEGVSRNLNEWKLRFCVCVLDPMSSGLLLGFSWFLGMPAPGSRVRGCSVNAVCTAALCFPRVFVLRPGPRAPQAEQLHTCVTV